MNADVSVSPELIVKILELLKKIKEEWEATAERDIEHKLTRAEASSPREYIEPPSQPQ